jgi:uncharacterized protein
LSFYVDTSVWVAALSNEAATARAQSWLAECMPGELHISDWVLTEFSSALAIKLRTGQLDEQQRAIVATEFSALIESSIVTLPVGRDDFRTAGHYCNHPKTGIRAGDALHLAICANHGLTMITLDKTLKQTGTKFGVASNTP